MASVVEKERKVVGRIGVSHFMGFLVIPMAGEGSKAMGRKKKGRGRKIEPLPELRWPLRPLIFDEHKKRVPRLSREKERNWSSTTVGGGLRGKGEAYL